jgi:hypothetical protein
MEKIKTNGKLANFMYKFFIFYSRCKRIVRKLRNKHILDHFTLQHY